jgi:hypothetical protein
MHKINRLTLCKIHLAIIYCRQYNCLSQQGYDPPTTTGRQADTEKEITKMDEALKRANQDTLAWRNRNVNRYNPSTQAQYSPCVAWYNKQTYYAKTNEWRPYGSKNINY